MAPKPAISLEEYCAIFARFGDPGRKYLEFSFPRFQATRERVLEGVGDRRGALIDIGAHWLHNCLLYALEGFEVTACDIGELGEMERNPVVRGVAEAYGIHRLSYADLARPTELAQLPEHGYDLVLFTEILEHITFNPVYMWRQIYRLLKPGGRLILTTPNYHYPGYCLRDWNRVLRGQSTGLPIAEILDIQTYGHHWKVYSAKDLRDYFRRVSPDFSIARLDYFDAVPATRWPGKLSAALSRVIPPLCQNLYLEVHLPKKRHGIKLEPHW
ncbi:MAG: methyltransferase domain-containing protein [Gammaproteobacteria bacterium]|nr:methyltransferase domain-containing protein [Gammaproteobacteria bacterium]